MTALYLKFSVSLQSYIILHFQVLLLFFIWQGIKYIHHFHIIFCEVYYLETKGSDETLNKMGSSSL